MGAVEVVRAERTGGYRRGRFTWAAFAGLLVFGFLNSALGPVLPYLRAAEHLSYLPAAAYQAAFAVGGGVAGLLSARLAPAHSRGAVLRLGLAGMAAAGLGLAYGSRYPITVLSAFAMSLLGTAALISIWSGLADAHGEHRAVAMTEGEVAVSLGGVTVPLVISAVAASVLGWQFAFVICAGGIVAVLVIFAGTRIPAQQEESDQPASKSRWLAPTLVLCFAVVALEWCVSFWLASYLDDDVGLSRGVAVAMSGGLYAAMLAGRLLASQLARQVSPERLLTGALAIALAGLLTLLGARGAIAAAVAVAIVGVGLGPTFPLTGALHVAANSARSTSAMSHMLVTASLGQILSPLIIGAIASATTLRAGLLVTFPLAALAAVALSRHARR